MEKLEEKQELTYYQKNREKISEKAKKKYAEDAEFLTSAFPTLRCLPVLVLNHLAYQQILVH